MRGKAFGTERCRRSDTASSRPKKRGGKVKKTLAIDPMHADTVRMIYRLALSGGRAAVVQQLMQPIAGRFGFDEQVPLVQSRFGEPITAEQRRCLAECRSDRELILPGQRLRQRK